MLAHKGEKFIIYWGKTLYYLVLTIQIFTAKIFITKIILIKVRVMIERQELLEQFNNTLKKMKKEWNKQFKEVNHSQFQILKILACDGPQKATELAETLQMTPGAITGASDKLVSKGYAERKGSVGDRRVVYMEITDKGKQLLKSMIEKQISVTAKFFEGLSDEDANHLIRIYRQISNNLDRQATSKPSNLI
jgi:DNA-binding MarR family transcriptional regulator